tara:strand:- start:405 stop:641 length:237 start_codon:yes stop_codon:yes gene_type:complete
MINELQSNTVGNTLNLTNTNTLNMDTLMIFIAIIIVIASAGMILASRKIVKDDNNNKIPDWLEDKFAEMKKEIKKLKK